MTLALSLLPPGGKDVDCAHRRFVVGGWEHAEPLLPLAALAQRRGHHVSFAGQVALRERLTQLGYAVDVVGPNTLATTPQPINAINRAAEQAVMRDQFIGRFARARAASLGDLFDREQAEVIVCDEVDVGAVIAAEHLCYYTDW